MSHKPREIKELRFKRKPKKCPNCGASRIANILYGLPALSEKLNKELEGFLSKKNNLNYLL